VCDQITVEAKLASSFSLGALSFWAQLQIPPCYGSPSLTPTNGSIQPKAGRTTHMLAHSPKPLCLLLRQLQPRGVKVDKLTPSPQLPGPSRRSGASPARAWIGSLHGRQGSTVQGHQRWTPPLPLQGLMATVLLLRSREVGRQYLTAGCAYHGRCALGLAALRLALL
jgi:hypothetical protein